LVGTIIKNEYDEVVCFTPELPDGGPLYGAVKREEDLGQRETGKSIIAKRSTIGEVLRIMHEIEPQGRKANEVNNDNNS
jgi:phosphatidate phosphatase PAH1